MPSIRATITFASIFMINPTAAAFTYQTYEKITAAVGDTVVLPCRTTLGVPVDWKYMMTNESQQPTYVYSNFVIYAEYLDKATTEQVNPATGRYDLTLHNVQLNDSGWFVCIEDGGLAEVHVRALDVSAAGADSSVHKSGVGSKTGVAVGIVLVAVLLIVVGVLICKRHAARKRFSLVSSARRKPQQTDDRQLKTNNKYQLGALTELKPLTAGTETPTFELRHDDPSSFDSELTAQQMTRNDTRQRNSELQHGSSGKKPDAESADDQQTPFADDIRLNDASRVTSDLGLRASGKEDETAVEDNNSLHTVAETEESTSTSPKDNRWSTDSRTKDLECDSPAENRRELDEWPSRDFFDNDASSDSPVSAAVPASPCDAAGADEELALQVEPSVAPGPVPNSDNDGDNADDDGGGDGDGDGGNNSPNDFVILDPPDDAAAKDDDSSAVPQTKSFFHRIFR